MNRFVAAVLALALSGCASFALRPGAASLAQGDNMGALPYMQSAPMLRELTQTGAGKIKHVVYVVQENRSFNDLFMGYPGATTAKNGKNSKGKTIALAPVSLATTYEIEHGAKAMFAACDGTGSLPGTKCRMDGFDRETSVGGPKNPQYVYVPRAESKPYWDIAREWVLADDMFQSQLDESFVAHQYIIAAQAKSSVDIPDGPWGCEGGATDKVEKITQARQYGGFQQACFDYQTLGDELDADHLPWRFYTSAYTQPFSGMWSGYQAVKHILDGPDWKKDVIAPQKRFLHDVGRGHLAAFTWITPTCPDSDHLDCGGGFGPSWVASVVNAVGKSKFWDSTAIFVQWDDWGGTYDPVAPPFEGYDGLGFRVPLLVASPYAKQNYVSHVQYETASVLRFAEDLFGLKHLTAADARANSPAADCFDFSQKPRKFEPIHAPQTDEFFSRQPVDPRIPDEQ
jgi:phospholipase C